jgi:transposase
MPRYLPLEPHLPPEAIHACFLEATGAERTHWHVIWLKSQGLRTGEIHRRTGLTAAWIREIIHRYNAGGPEALRDRRRHNAGAPCLLTPVQKTELRRLIAAAPDAWNGPRVARWIAEVTGRAVVHPQRGWEYLRRLAPTGDGALPSDASTPAARVHREEEAPRR